MSWIRLSCLSVTLVVVGVLFGRDPEKASQYTWHLFPQDKQPPQGGSRSHQQTPNPRSVPEGKNKFSGQRPQIPIPRNERKNKQSPTIVSVTPANIIIFYSHSLENTEKLTAKTVTRQSSCVFRRSFYLWLNTSSLIPNISNRCRHEPILRTLFCSVTATKCNSLHQYFLFYSKSSRS